MTLSLLPAQHHSCTHKPRHAQPRIHPNTSQKVHGPSLSPFALFPPLSFPFSAATGCAPFQRRSRRLEQRDPDASPPFRDERNCSRVIPWAKYSPCVTKMNLDGLVRCPARASLWCRLVLFARSERGSFFRLPRSSFSKSLRAKPVRCTTARRGEAGDAVIRLVRVWCTLCTLQ